MLLHTIWDGIRPGLLQRISTSLGLGTGFAWLSDRHVKKDKVFSILLDISCIEIHWTDTLEDFQFKCWKPGKTLVSQCTGKAVAFTKPCTGSCCLLQPVWAPGVSKAREHPCSFQTLLQLAALQELCFQLCCTLRRWQQPEDELWLTPASSCTASTATRTSMSLGRCFCQTLHATRSPRSSRGTVGAGWLPAAFLHLALTGFHCWCAVCLLHHVPEANISFKLQTSTVGMTSFNGLSWLYGFSDLAFY